MDRPTKVDFTMIADDIDYSYFDPDAYREALERYIDYLEAVNSYLDDDLRAPCF